MFLVTEARGPVGAAAVEWLAAKGYSVRAAVPDAGKFRQRRKVEPIRFDWSEPEGWDAALTGLEGLVLIGPPDVWGMESKWREFLAMASERGCRRVAFLSVAEAESDPWAVHRKIEDHLRNSGMSWTFLRAGAMAHLLVERRRTAIASVEISVPVGMGTVAWLDPRDVGEAAARALLDEVWDQRAPLLTGPEALDIETVCQIVSRETDAPVVCRRCSSLRYAARLRFREGLSLGRCIERIRRSRRLCADRSSLVSDDLRLLLGRAPRRFEDFVRDHRLDFHPEYESPATRTTVPATKSRKSKRSAAACEV